MACSRWAYRTHQPPAHGQRHQQRAEQGQPDAPAKLETGSIELIQRLAILLFDPALAGLLEQTVQFGQACQQGNDLGLRDVLLKAATQASATMRQPPSKGGSGSEAMPSSRSTTASDCARCSSNRWRNTGLSSTRYCRALRSISTVRSPSSWMAAVNWIACSAAPTLIDQPFDDEPALYSHPAEQQDDQHEAEQHALAERKYGSFVH